ncbi:hypothetical protein DPMN_001358 [Dreissena polymorpha]|uniref:Uncharacterized protein n=1 Tax=Dreissena polymorpha TaxID=45954 RepID=A0A9D4MHL6_DREPO|nr:hypothetical protein DPMN_001358 [Dreissena polymorpha]
MDNYLVKTICRAITVDVPFINILTIKLLNVEEATEDPTTPMAQLEMREIRRNQMKDPVIGKWRIATIDQKPIDKVTS